MTTSLTDEQAEALGRRLLAKGCPWRAGMRWVSLRAAPLPDVEGRTTEPVPMRSPYGGAWPDLRDAATRGCVLEALREKVGDPWLHVGRRLAGWGVWTSKSTPMPMCIAKADTEAEALVRAWEATND